MGVSYISRAASKASCMALKRMRGLRQSPTTWTSGAESRSASTSSRPGPQVPAPARLRRPPVPTPAPARPPRRPSRRALLATRLPFARPDAVLVQVVLQHDHVDEVHRLVAGRPFRQFDDGHLLALAGQLERRLQAHAPIPGHTTTLARHRPRPSSHPPPARRWAHPHPGCRAAPVRRRPRRPLHRGLRPSPGSAVASTPSLTSTLEASICRSM